MDSIVSDVENLLQAVGTYAQFESVFTSPEDTDPQVFLENYKDSHMKSKLGRDAVDLIYDVFGGEHDDMLAEHIKPDGEWAKTVDWRLCDIAGWTEMAQQFSLHGSVSIESKPPSESAARSRVLARSLSNASDEAKEEQKQKESERDKVWVAATSSRRKLVNFMSPRSSWKAKDLDAAYEASPAYKWDGGKPAEKHRVFIFSADLIDESGNCWAKTMPWPAALGEECVKFMRSKTGRCDLLVFCDGR